MKAHVGVDAESGLVHTAGVTTGKVHDAKVMHRLIREDDRAVYGDKGYASDEKKCAAEDAGVLWAVKKTDEASACSQSPFRQGARQGRTRLPRRQMPVQLSQGALPRHREERRAAVRPLRARQHLPRSQPTCVRMKKR